MTLYTKTKSAPAGTEALKVTASHPNNDQKDYSILKAALQYAAQGFYVLPVAGKVALTEHAKDDATTDPEQIRSWWKKWPRANVAINLERSGLFALDVDNPDSWERLKADHGGKSNNGPIQVTPRGGRHLIWIWPEGLMIPAKVNAFDGLGYPGLDLRSRSYIVLAPSQIEGKPYAWLADHGPEMQILPPPEWLADMIRGLRTPAEPRPDKPLPNRSMNDKVKWARSLLDRLAPFRCSNYSDWIQVGMALSELGEAGLDLWDAWSKSCPEKYKGFEDCSIRWQPLKPGYGISLGSLHYWAEQDNPIDRNGEPMDSEDLAIAALSTEQLLEEVKASAGAWADRDDLDEEESEGNSPAYPAVSYMPGLPDTARLKPKEEELALQAGRWVDDYVQFAANASPMTPSLFHRSLALSILATAIARRVKVHIAKKDIFPNLYMLLIAPSTLYAKTTGFDVALDLLDMAGLAHFTLPHGVTPQSLITEMSSRTPPTFSEWGQDDKDDWAKERTFGAQRSWWMDEAASLLDLFKQKHTADLLAIILKLYDCPKKLSASTLGRGRETIRYGYLTVCGPTTPAAMRIHLKTPELWGDGLFARFLLVTPDKGPVRVFYPEKVDIPPELVQHINCLAFQRLEIPQDPGIGKLQAPAAIQAIIPPTVWKKWDNYHAGIFALLSKRTVPEKLFACYGRFPTTVIKIAQLLAASDWVKSNKDNPLIIQPVHWDRAQMMTEEYRASLHRMIDDASQPVDDEDQELAGKVMNRANTTRNSRREIAQDLHMAAGFQRDRLDKIINQLITDGCLEEREIKQTRGPGTKRIYTKNP